MVHERLICKLVQFNDQSMKRYQTVDAFISNSGDWQPFLEKLREIILGTEVEETVKWGAPVYTVNGKNIIGLGSFKSYVGLWFFQGVFLKDEKKVLMNAQEGTTKALRQWRFARVEEIDPKLVRSYVVEAIENQKAGKELKPDRTKKQLVLSAELKEALKSDPKLQDAFNSLTPGKQREYADHIASAKQDKTRLSRLEKVVPMIKSGVGLHDKYKNC